jgi:zinc protease
MKKLIAAVAALLLCGTATATPLPGMDEVRMRTMDNGMEVLIWPDHDIPNATLYFFVKAGGRNEYPGITGLSHFFEHMMFNGTTTLAPGEFDRVMEAAGGANNAYTTNDLTVYTDWFPVTAMPVIMDIESDRLANLAFDPEVVESERGVVYSERRLRVDDSNIGFLLEQAQATAYVAHPYQFPVIGWPSDIENWTMDDLQSFFTTYYAPNNLVMVITGDVDPEQTFEDLEDWFGDIPAQEPPEPVTTVEPVQTGERRVSVDRDSQTGVVLIGFHVVEEAHGDTPALELLDEILSSGESSRLYQRLVDQYEIAIDVGAFLRQGFDPGTYWLYAITPPGQDLAQVEEVLLNELQKIVLSGVSASELEKARNLRLMGFLRSMATIAGKANALGNYQVFYNDWRALFTAPERLEAVTVEDLQTVAARYFIESNRTVATLAPAEVTAEDRDHD